MEISIKNIGSIKQAKFELNDFTIICGKNNTGKTYVTYATYGFLDYWHSGAAIDIDKKIINDVMEKGSISIPIDVFAKKSDQILQTASNDYSKSIDKVFAGKKKFFEDSKFEVKVTKDKGYKTNQILFRAGSVGRSILKVSKEKNDENLIISLLVDKDSEDLPPRSFLGDMISAAVREIVFKDKVPRPFIASAERTGSAIFQKELDFTRNRLIDLIGDKESRISSGRLLGRFKAEYPIPVRKNVDFIRDLPNIVNRESVFSSEHPGVLEKFSDIIGGEYKVTKDGEVQFIPTAKRTVKLSLVESSSAVRSLLDIGFYLRHVARSGDILIVDEPELNLHPENQRKVARLFATMVNYGIKVFITTHSDYLVKELNTLILLNKNDDHIKEIAKREDYKDDELLDVKRLKIYIAQENLIQPDGKKRKSKCQTLVEAPISEQNGIEIGTFDETIENMNRIQEELIWGVESD